MSLSALYVGLIVSRKIFTVHWRDHGGGVDSASYIYLDGYLVPGRFIFGIGDAQRSGARVGPALERPFTFAKAEGGKSLLRSLTYDLS